MNGEGATCLTRATLTKDTSSIGLRGLQAFLETAEIPETARLTQYVLCIEVRAGHHQVGWAYPAERERVLRQFEQALAAALARSVWGELAITTRIWNELYLVLFPAKGTTGQTDLNVQMLLRETELGLDPATDALDVRLRYALSPPLKESGLGWVDRIFTQMQEATRRVTIATVGPPAGQVAQFHDLMANGAIRPLYQPIMDLLANQVLGWEGLSRGPSGTELESPVALFRCAEELGYLFELESICRSRIVENARLAPHQSLFLNVHPRTFADPNFRHGQTLDLIRTFGLRPEQIVFEITEHQAVQDYRLFNQTIHHYRGQGYKIAIDDTGAGHSGLVTLMEVKPDFVKVDMSLIRDIDVDETKQRIVSAILHVSDSFGATVIAEGIETEREHATLCQCGVQFGQGYRYGAPQPFLPTTAGMQIR